MIGRNLCNIKPPRRENASQTRDEPVSTRFVPHIKENDHDRKAKINKCGRVEIHYSETVFGYHCPIATDINISRDILEGGQEENEKQNNSKITLLLSTFPPPN
jgi:hypothetical protein